MYLNVSQIHENVAGGFILFWRHHSQHLGHGSWWIMAVITNADAGCLHVHCLPQLLLRGELHLSNVHLMLRWVHWDGNHTALWKCTKRAKVHDAASRIMTFHLFREIILNILNQHTSLLWFFVLLKSQPWVEQRSAGWVVGWLNVSCILSVVSQSAWQKSWSSSIPSIFQLVFNKMLAWEPDFCIKSLSCRYHSPMSCENSGWSLSALWWILEKTPDLWQVRNC